MLNKFYLKKFKEQKPAKQPVYFYIPSNFDVDELIATNPTDAIDNFDKWKLLYIIHLINYLPAISRKQRDYFGFVRLSSQYLKKLIENYKSYLDYLIDSEVIVLNKSYSNRDNFSKSYKLDASYSNRNINFIELPHSKFTTSLSKHWQKKETNPIIKAQVEFLRNVVVDIEAAHKYFANIRIELFIKQDQEAIDYFKLREDEIRINLLRISVKDIHIIIDETSGRLHSNLTGLKKEFRHFLSYNGEHLVGIDIKCCQPYLLQLLIKENFWFSIKDEITDEQLLLYHSFSLKNKTKAKKLNHKRVETLKEIINSHYQRLQTQGASEEESCFEFAAQRMREELREGIRYKGMKEVFNMWKNPEILKDLGIIEEFEAYREVVNSKDIYNYLLDIANDLLANDKTAQAIWDKNLRDEKSKFKTLDRSSLKVMVLIALYAPEKSKRAITKFSRYIFYKAFPNMLSILDNLKSMWFKTSNGKRTNAYNSVAILLQAIESYIVLEKIVTRIINEHPAIPVFTIHDSIVTSNSNVETVKQIVDEEFTRFVGVKPQISFENYSLSSINYDKLPYVETDELDIDELAFEERVEQEMEEDIEEINNGLIC